ncbi:histone-lysine N-methyltransferase ASHH2 [Tanacetum coccineum]
MVLSSLTFSKLTLGTVASQFTGSNVKEEAFSRKDILEKIDNLHLARSLHGLQVQMSMKKLSAGHTHEVETWLDEHNMNLTASDTSIHEGFFVPRRAAEKSFSPLGKEIGLGVRYIYIYLIFFFAKQPCVEDKFALKRSVAHDCMHEGAGISTSIHRNVLEGANIVTPTECSSLQRWPCVESKSSLENTIRHKYVQEVPGSSAPVQCDDRLEQPVATVKEQPWRNPNFNQPGFHRDRNANTLGRRYFKQQKYNNSRPGHKWNANKYGPAGFNQNQSNAGVGYGGNENYGNGFYQQPHY